MERDLTPRMSCVVCGIETKRHNGWFLVTENRWLDRVRVFSWHPVVARQPRMNSVCGEDHLRTLLTHWLTYANLEFLATGFSQWPPRGRPQPGVDFAMRSLGRVVGELAVHRESLSRVWTGSPESLACILDALIGGMEIGPRPSAMTFRAAATGYAAHIPNAMS